MKIRLRYSEIISVLAAVGSFSLGIPAMAAGWQPEGPVEIVVPTGAGGENDRVARFVQRIFEQKKLVTTPVLVVNKSGGNQVLSLVYFSKKAPDPQFLLYTTGTVLSNQIAGLTELGYHDVTPIAKLRCDNTALTVAGQ